jgi:hypothetical protein
VNTNIHLVVQIEPGTRGLTSVQRFGFVAAHRWTDAEDVAEKHWPKANSVEYGFVYTYNLATGMRHLHDWQVPLDRFDPTLPQVAP